MSEYTQGPDLVDYIRSLDSRIAALEAGPKGLWQIPTLINGWVAYGPTYESPGFLADDFGFVHLRGIIKGGVEGSVAFVLPKGLRPVFTAQYAVVSTGFAIAVISNNGQVQITGNPAVTTAVSLSGITFLAEK